MDMTVNLNPDDAHLAPLPLVGESNLESVALLKQVAQAHRYLAELKGVAKTIPNEAILISTLSMQEAKDSSAIENIFTTHDQLFQSQVLDHHPCSSKQGALKRAVKLPSQGCVLAVKLPISYRADTFDMKWPALLFPKHPAPFWATSVSFWNQ